MALNDTRSGSNKPRSHPANNSGSKFPIDHEVLPKVSISKYRLEGRYNAALHDGVAELSFDEMLPEVVTALHSKGMTPVQIASAIWNSQGLGARVKTSGYDFLTDVIVTTLQQNDDRIAYQEREVFDEWCYVERQSGYWNRRENNLLDIENFKLRLLAKFGGGRDKNAHMFFHTRRHAHPNAVVDDLNFWPGEGPVVSFNGARCINRWSPPDVEFGDGDINQWSRLAERLIPDKKIREHVFNLFAWVVQNPGKKPGHHLLLGGIPGAGKDTFFEPILYALGGGIPIKGSEVPADRKFVARLRNADLENGFQYHLNNKLLVLQELRAVYAGERRKLGNELKNLLAAPPHTLSVNESTANRSTSQTSTWS